MSAGIYAIVNIRTDESYVGRSERIERRFQEHLCCLRKGSHYSKRLQEAWNAYGEGAFAFCVISLGSENLIEREQNQLDWVRSVGMNYNDARFSRGGSPLGWKHTDEAKRMMSESRRGIPKPPGHGKRVSAAMRQLPPRPPEWCSKLSSCQIGKVMSLEHREKLRLAGIGRVQTDETKAKIKAALTGQKRTPEQIARIIAGRWPKKVEP